MSDQSQPPAQRPARCAAAALIASAVLGCGGGDEPAFEKFETLQFRELLVEVPLGDYTVPVPVVSNDEAGGATRTNLLEMKFTLHGLVKPDLKPQMLDQAERQEGQLRDSVIRVCRNLPIDDVLDPQLATLRSRVLDSTQSLFEGSALRRVLVTDVTCEPL